MEVFLLSEKDSVNAALVNPEDREEYHRSLGLTKKIESRKIILVGRSRCGKTTLIRRLHNLDMSYHKTQSIEAWSDAIDTPGEYTDTPFFSRGAAITPAYDADIVCFCHDCGNDICRLPQMFSMSFARPVIGIVTKRIRTILPPNRRNFSSITPEQDISLSQVPLPAAESKNSSIL